MLDFNFMGPVELPGEPSKRKLQNEKFLSTVGLDPTRCRAAPAYKSTALRSFDKHVLLEHVHV